MAKKSDAATAAGTPATPATADQTGDATADQTGDPQVDAEAKAKGDVDAAADQAQQGADVGAGDVGAVESDNTFTGALRALYVQAHKDRRFDDEAALQTLELNFGEVKRSLPNALRAARAGGDERVAETLQRMLDSV